MSEDEAQELWRGISSGLGAPWRSREYYLRQLGNIYEAMDALIRCTVDDTEFAGEEIPAEWEMSKEAWDTIWYAFDAIQHMPDLRDHFAAEEARRVAEIKEEMLDPDGPWAKFVHRDEALARIEAGDFERWWSSGEWQL